MKQDLIEMQRPLNATKSTSLLLGIAIAMDSHVLQHMKKGKATWVFREGRSREESQGEGSPSIPPFPVKEPKKKRPPMASLCSSSAFSARFSPSELWKVCCVWMASLTDSANSFGAGLVRVVEAQEQSKT